MDETHFILSNIIDEVTKSVTRLINEAYELGLENGKKSKDKDTDEIKIGSVVEECEDKGVITYMDVVADNDSFDVLWEDGFCSKEGRNWVEEHLNGEVVDINEVLRGVFKLG